jgi:CRISPR-associated protein Cas6/Cse3/CasE subtype I-E
MIAGLAKGAPTIFADCGDHVVMRTAKPVDAVQRPVREVKTSDVIAFELRASCGKKTKGRHRYWPVSDWKPRHDWLDRQGERHGFSIITVHASAGMLLIEKAGRKFTVDRTDFVGVLKVTDLERFKRAIAEGIGGKAKAFGFGLIQI